MKTLIIFIMVSLLVFCSQSYAAPIILTVGNDNDCDFQTLQEAVDSENVSMDIRVTNQTNINARIVIGDGDDVSSLNGGYQNCNDAADGIIDDSKPYTNIFGSTGDAVLTILKQVDVNYSINVNRFKVHNGISGVEIISGIKNTTLNVNFDFVDIYLNNLSGIVMRGTGVAVTFNNGKIYDNASVSGGGIYCNGSELYLGENVAIYDNRANDGGGIFATNCSVILLAGDNNAMDALERGIFNNQASTSGAGVYLDKSILRGFGAVSHPVSISGNTIINDDQFGIGGGIYMLSGSSVIMSNARIDGNTATTTGGAIATHHNDTNLEPPFFVISRDKDDGCDYAEICTSLSNNSISGNGYGSIIYQYGGGFGYLVQAIMKGNGSENSNSLFKTRSGSQLFLFSDLLVSNVSGLNIFDQEDESEVYIQYSTLADNSGTNYFNVQYDNNNPQVLEVDSSIIANGAATIANLNNDGGNHDAQVKCSLVEADDASGVVQNLSFVADPRFIGNGNYKLKPNSFAIGTSCGNIGEFDIARYDVRDQDRNTDDATDLGAYENIMADDVLFSSNFEIEQEL